MQNDGREGGDGRDQALVGGGGGGGGGGRFYAAKRFSFHHTLFLAFAFFSFSLDRKKKKDSVFDFSSVELTKANPDVTPRLTRPVW